MLTLQKDKTSTEIVEVHKKSTRSKRAHGVVYYSHNTKASGNVAPAAGVLALTDQVENSHSSSGCSGCSSRNRSRNMYWQVINRPA